MTKLLILGGGESHVPIIKTAQKIGVFSIVMDKNSNASGLKIADKAICSNGADKKEVLRIAKEQKVNGILSTGDYSVIPAAYAAQKLGLPSLGFDIAKLATNKGKLFSEFEKKKVSIPPRIVTRKFSEALDAVNELKFPIILKPEYSFGASKGVIRVNNKEELLEKYQFTKKYCLKKGIIVEKFLDGVEHTIESLIVNGKTNVTAISDKTRTKDLFCVATSLNYPSTQNKKIIKKLTILAKRANAAAGIKNGASHMEAISLMNKAYVIDFGSRGGAGGYIPAMIVPNLNGIEMMEKMILLALGKTVGQIESKKNKGLIYRFFSAKPGKIIKISGISKAKKISGLIDMKFYLKKGDSVNILSNQLQRPGFFVVVGKNRKDAEKKADLIENTIKIITK